MRQFFIHKLLFLLSSSEAFQTGLNPGETRYRRNNNSPSISLCATLAEVQELRARDVFKSFDIDSSGGISASELSKMLQALEINTTDEDAMALFAYLDQDEDGAIGLEDFLPWYSQAAVSALELAASFQTVLTGRRTVDRFDPTPVDDSVLRRAVECAIAAPNRSGSEPWRFLQLGPETIAQISQLRAEMETHGAEMTDWSAIPGWCVVTSKVSANAEQELEDFRSTSCAVQNFLLSMWSEGIGTKWTSGCVQKTQEFAEVCDIDLQNEKVVGCIWYGFATGGLTNADPKRRQKSALELLRRLSSKPARHTGYAINNRTRSSKSSGFIIMHRHRRKSPKLLKCFCLLSFLSTAYCWVTINPQQPQLSALHSQSQTDERYYSFLEAPARQSSPDSPQPITITRYLQNEVKQNPDLEDLESLLLAVQMACKTIGNLVGRAGLVFGDSIQPKNLTDGRYYSMKRLDQLSTLVLQNALQYTGKCKIVAPADVIRHDTDGPDQHQPGVLLAQSTDQAVACMDPLDGSGNADASICTGTVFGVWNGEKANDTVDETQHLVDSVLQPAKNMRAAGYCLYSSATVLVFTLGETVQGFTLDPQINEFVLTHPNLTIPSSGTVYSCNEGNSEGWDQSFRDYITAIKTAKGYKKEAYAHRYVGSMVGDIHRTLLYGGIFAYPADTGKHPDGNLQLLYKTAPLAFIVDRAGGRGIDGRTGDLLDVVPQRVHQKSPCFLGSPKDVDELESYLNNAVKAVT